MSVVPSDLDRHIGDPVSATPLFRYAVVDLANAKSIRVRVPRQLPSVAAPLLDRKMPYRLLTHGPWILKLSPNPKAREIREQDLSDENWGYFISTSVDIDSLRQTLRRFNLVHLEGETTPVLFRYWDPRVMKLFLKVSTRQQMRSVFEFIHQIEFTDGEVFARANVYRN